MSKILCFLISFVLLLGLSSAAQAVSVEVPNFSFELDVNGAPFTEFTYLIDQTTGSRMLGWEIDELFGGDWTLVSMETAMQGAYSLQVYDNGGSLYQVLAHPIIAGRRYNLNFDGAAAGASGHEIIATLFYDPGDGSQVTIASNTYSILNVGGTEWHVDWYPHLSLSFIAEAGYAGKNLGIKLGFPVAAWNWNTVDNVRLDESPVELAWDANPSHAFDNVAVDMNEASPRYMKLIVGVTSYPGYRGYWYDDTEAKLTWEPGDYANKHTVYFGSSLSDVNESATPVSVEQDANNYDPGVLELGQTYYWRVDEVNTTTSTTWQGPVWDFTVLTAIQPPIGALHWDNDDGDNLWCSPSNWDTDILPAVTNWERWYGGDSASIDVCSMPNPVLINPGCDAECTWVFVGETNDVGYGLDVNGGTLTTMEVVIGEGPNGVGEVTMSSGTVDLLNWSRLAVGRYGGTGTFEMTGGQLNALGTTYDGEEVDWAGTVEIPYGGGSGHFQFDGGTIKTRQLSMGTGGTMDITGGTMIITENLYAPDWPETRRVNWWYGQGMITAYDDEGILDVVFADPCTTVTAVMRDPNLAWKPSPRDYDPDAALDPILSWSPGDKADKHTVYFGTSISDVNESATPVSVEQDANTYNSGGLELGTMYYWRIDEVNTSTVETWTGYIWTFTTAGYGVVDDFDSYPDHPDLRAVWTIGHLTGNGAEIFRETDPELVHDGNSMMFAYRNYTDIGGYVGSEAVANTSDLGAGSNWTASGVKALVLYFYGDLINGTDHDSGYVYPITVDQMYVALEDGSSNVGIVKYEPKPGFDDYDMNDIKEASWHEWNIDLADPCLADVNMANVAKVYIGFGGQKTGQSVEGAGNWSDQHDTVWFDDIEVWPARCVPAFSFPAGDFTGDCIIDYFDVDAIARGWLISSIGDVTAAAPAADFVGHWPLDDNVSTGSPTAKVKVVDTTGNYDGTLHDALDYPGLNTAAHSTTGIINLALTFDGLDDYVEIPALNLNSNTVTISAWIKRDGDFPASPIVFSRDANTAGAGLTFGTTGDPDWAADNLLGYSWNDADEATWSFDTGLFIPDMLWTFVAVAVEPAKATVYLYDGTLYAARNYVANAPEEFDGATWIGADLAVKDPETFWWLPFKGTIDDVTIYNRTLPPGEMLYLALQGPGSQYLALEPWYADADDDDKVDFKDYAIMANNWLAEILFP